MCKMCNVGIGWIIDHHLEVMLYDLEKKEMFVGVVREVGMGSKVRNGK